MRSRRSSRAPKNWKEEKDSITLIETLAILVHIRDDQLSISNIRLGVMGCDEFRTWSWAIGGANFDRYFLEGLCFLKFKSSCFKII